MDIKSKNKIKSYFSNIWLVELVILGILSYYNILDIINIESLKREPQIFFLSTSINALLILKVLYALLKNRGKIKIRGNFIVGLIYVLRYGFQYKQTRKVLAISIIVSVLFCVFYLYVLALGGYTRNVLVNFFTVYPFKGSSLMMILPLIAIMFSIKKSLEISMVNDGLKRINEGDLDYDIVKQGGPEVLELIENINKIKDGYQISVQEVLKNEKLKTELISNVSHDLRTPLTSIINYVNILGGDNITEEERVDYLSILERKSKKLKVLIDDLFEASKINSGKIEINKEKIDIMSLIHQGIGEYFTIYENKNLDFKVDSVKEEIFMELDGKMMSRAIENIIINAIKYSLDGTRVYVYAKEENGYLVLSFKNISNYDMDFDNEDIFERFARADKSRTSNVEGSGLGLAITRSIIELHGGLVKINREGDMFKIYVYLPLDTQDN